MKFKISDFCEKQRDEFKLYYNYLNKPEYIQQFLLYFDLLNTERIKSYIFNGIKRNHNYILDKIKKIDIIISFYKENNLINKSEIGKFFHFYELHRKNINLKDDNQLFDLFYDLIKYPNVIGLLKECFYIFSDYRACIYYMTPSSNFYKVTSNNKLLLNKVVKNFKDNINTLNQLVSKIYVDDITPWKSLLYTTAYSMFETLIILNKYYKNPLKEIGIIFNIKEECKKMNIIKELCKNYHIKKLKKSEIDEKINEKNVNTISHFILILKRLGYDLWYVIYLVFDTIYPKYKFKGISNPIINIHEKIHLQIKNNELGIMCYILTSKGFISNSNIFIGFND